LARLGRHRGELAWMAVVAAAYFGATFWLSRHAAGEVDRMMTLADNMFHGHVDLGQLARMNDIVTIDGRNYEAMSLLPVVPYWFFVPFHPLWEASRWIIPATLGTITGWLALPLARRYGPAGSASYWLAALGAFGTLLFTQSIFGNFYYLAQVEAMLLTFLALIEWQGQRRPWLIGGALALAALARPTVLLAVIPFGLLLLWERKDRIRVAVVYSAPILAALFITAWWNYVRFGSVLETGYGISTLSPQLAQARAQGLFSLSHLRSNLSLFIGGGFGVFETVPSLKPNPAGQSMLLTTPALLIAVGAGVRSRANLVLWAAAGLVAVPVFLYYGGGGADTYGYRYALDFTPFLLALVAIAAKQRFGNLEKLLIGLSVAFVTYGFVYYR
jgi:hypothetical protein